MKKRPYFERFLAGYICLGIVALAAVGATFAVVKQAWFPESVATVPKVAAQTVTTEATATVATDPSSDSRYNQAFALTFREVINKDADAAGRAKLEQVSCVDGQTTGHHYCSFVADGQCYAAEVVEKSTGEIVVNSETAGKVDLDTDKCYAIPVLQAIPK